MLSNEQDAEDAFQAVFLVLHRKSRQVRWHLSLANWLYGVAYRVALKGRERVQNRRESNLENAEMIADRDPLADEWADVGPAVHEEINRLPARYRATLVLCCLEGKSRAQAARDLGLSETTIKGRLERGRGMLKTRLAKRNLVLPAVLTGAAIAGHTAEAAISESLVAATTQAAAKFAAGSSASGPLLPVSMTLAKGQLASMLLMTQIKIAVVAVSLLCTAGIGSAVVYYGGAPASPTEPGQTPQDDQPQETQRNGEDQPQDPGLPDEWRTLNDAEKDRITKRHLHALIFAVHCYADANEGLLPPAAVPNPDLPADKRLSGLVLLLP